MLSETAPFGLEDVVVVPTRHVLEVDGSTRHVEPRVMRLLLALAERPGEVWTRAELLDRVWGGSFVEEEALTQAVSMLRKALGDDRRRRAFIETIPKQGYRLLPQPRRPELSREASLPRRARGRHFRRLAAVSLGLIGAVSVLAALRGWDSRTADPLEPRPLTAWKGRESQPALSPDGRQLAFVGSVEGDADGLYVQPLVDGVPRRLTRSETPTGRPAWSPDSRRIAFARLEEGRCALVSTAVATGEERLVSDCPSGDLPHVAWTPDGTHLVVAEREASLPRYRLVLVAVAGGARRALTSPPPGLGDRFPAVSPDGDVAFVRTTSLGASDVFVLESTGRQPRRLTDRGDPISGLAWSASGDTILFGADRGGGYALWEVGRRGGPSRWVPVAGGEAMQPSVSPAGLAFERPRLHSQVWRQRAGQAPIPLLSSTRWDEQPAVSGDGRTVAWISDRSGRPEVWLIGRDGRHPRRLTALEPGAVGGMRWSPDERRIALSARLGGQSDVFVVDVGTGSTTAIDGAGANEVAPAWSADGTALYFLSDREQGWGVWRVDVAGGHPRLVAAVLASSLWAAPDGEGLYLSRFDREGIWRLSTKSRRLQLVEPRLDPGDFAHWGVNGEHLYLTVRRHGPPRIVRLDPRTGQEESLGIARFSGDDLGLAVAGDGELFYALADESESDLLWLPAESPRSRVDTTPAESSGSASRGGSRRHSRTR